MKHFLREIEQLKYMIHSLCALVETSVKTAVRSIEEKDSLIAHEVIEKGDDVDQMENDIDEKCIMILSLFQPVAIDLRLIIAISKINTQLERIGDLAENIAERAIFLADKDRIEIPFNFSDMKEKTLLMLKKSINALADMDIDLAYEVCLSDDEVDNINKQMYQQIEAAIRRDMEHLNSFIHLLGVSRNFERIADNATNIAEEVIYVIRGNIVRHKIQLLSTSKNLYEAI